MTVVPLPADTDVLAVSVVPLVLIRWKFAFGAAAAARYAAWSNVKSTSSSAGVNGSERKLPTLTRSGADVVLALTEPVPPVPSGALPAVLVSVGAPPEPT